MQVRLLGQPAAFDVSADGPAFQFAVAGTIAGVGTLDFPGTIAPGGTFQSGPIQTCGMTHLALGGTLSQAGTFEIAAFLDPAATTPNGPPATLAVSAGVGATLDVNLGVVAGSVTVSIVNGGSAAATLANPILVMQSR
jgi:hypothetical protein